MFVIEPHRQMIEVAVYAFNAARENDDNRASPSRPKEREP